jgi:hypothetical protein
MDSLVNRRSFPLIEPGCRDHRVIRDDDCTVSGYSPSGVTLTHGIYNMQQLSDMG